MWIILPNQLFKHFIKNDDIYLYEHPFFFTAYKYHKLKLILHRASMKTYYEHLSKLYKVKYLDYDYDIESLFKRTNTINIYDPVDHDIMKKFQTLANKHGVTLQVHESPLFICSVSDLEDYQKLGFGFHHNQFYIWQRKRLGILMVDDKPVGGSWSFDKENRLPFHKGFNIDMKTVNNESQFVVEAKQYVNKYFSGNPGSTDFYLPIKFSEVKKYFKSFLRDRLDYFGPYEDAVDKNIVFGNHSALSPLMNIGLITPVEIVELTIQHYNKNKNKIKLQSVEAFLRQIIGWREMMRMIYQYEHANMIKLNHFGHERKLNRRWYSGATGIAPIDDLIKKVYKYAYAHHIERLMYLGNFMLLSEINPKSIYDWFMTLFIDAYPWVMEGNVYAMSQYSAGGILMTRPYFSASNYIAKMSNYKKTNGKYPSVKVKNQQFEWYDIWNALYYRFVFNNKSELAKNYASAAAVAIWNKKSKYEKDKLLKLADDYLSYY